MDKNEAVAFFKAKKSVQQNKTLMNAWEKYEKKISSGNNDSKIKRGGKYGNKSKKVQRNQSGF